MYEVLPKGGLPVVTLPEDAKHEVAMIVHGNECLVLALKELGYEKCDDYPELERDGGVVMVPKKKGTR